MQRTYQDEQTVEAEKEIAGWGGKVVKTWAKAKILYLSASQDERYGVEFKDGTRDLFKVNELRPVHVPARK